MNVLLSLVMIAFLGAFTFRNVLQIVEIYKAKKAFKDKKEKEDIN